VDYGPPIPRSQPLFYGAVQGPHPQGIGARLNDRILSLPKPGALRGLKEEGLPPGVRGGQGHNQGPSLPDPCVQGRTLPSSRRNLWLQHQKKVGVAGQTGQILVPALDLNAEGLQPEVEGLATPGSRAEGGPLSRALVSSEKGLFAHQEGGDPEEKDGSCPSQQGKAVPFKPHAACSNLAAHRLQAR